jgi:hypothetical protein
MIYALTKQDEQPDITVKWLEENFDNANRTKVLLQNCKIYQRGKYIVIEHQDKILYYEHDGEYCFILDAIEYIKPENPDTWKTVGALVTFRQAIRECTQQAMGLEDLYQFDDGINLGQFNHFIATARVYDERHHGSVTF